MQNSTANGNDAACDRIRQEMQALGERLRALEKSIQDLKAQFERFVILIHESLENLGTTQPAEEPEPALKQARPLPAPHSDEASKKLHEDAMRYARLLVAEIELYNKEEVARGRENKDLYVRLKFHIDRSRKAYESRFGRSVIEKPDYFHEELTRALAHNEPSCLGPDYPSPYE